MADTLLSFQQLILPSEIKWELLIVNNNCTDDTDRVIKQFAGRLPIRCLHEKQQGLSHARNCAVNAANGDYLLWTDDDVIVDRNWVAAYASAIKARPNAVVFGGPIKLKFEGTPPSWFGDMLRHERFAAVYAHRDLSKTSIKIDGENWEAIPYGPNLCIRIQEQRLFRYKPYLGRTGNGQVRGEETQVVEAILRSGAEGWWVPNAIVHHVITKDLQTLAHLRRYFIGIGRSKVRNEPRSLLGSFVRASSLLLPAAQREVRFQMNRFRKPSKTLFEDLEMASVRWGRLFEYLHPPPNLDRGRPP